MPHYITTVQSSPNSTSPPIPISWVLLSLYGFHVLEILVIAALLISYIRKRLEDIDITKKYRRFSKYDQSILDFMKSVARADKVIIGTYKDLVNVPKQELDLYKKGTFVVIDKQRVTDPKCLNHMHSQGIEIMINRCIPYKNKILAILSIQYYSRPSVPTSELFSADLFNLLETLYRRLV